MTERYRVLDREETCGLIAANLGKGERIVVSRWADGVYRLMRGQHAAREDPAITPLLERGIKAKGQLVCINHLKPHNLRKKDVWYKTQKFLAEIGGHRLYGCANWNIHDYQEDCRLVPRFFSGNVLIVSGQHELVGRVFAGVSGRFECYPARARRASADYGTMSRDLRAAARDGRYANILFCCGPIGRVVLADLIPECESNLVDIGALINAIVDPYADKSFLRSWGMSWARKADVQALSDRFFDRLGEAEALA